MISMVVKETPRDMPRFRIVEVTLEAVANFFRGTALIISVLFGLWYIEPPIPDMANAIMIIHKFAFNARKLKYDI